MTPQFVAWLMGGLWIDELGALETDKFQQWQQQHSGLSSRLTGGNCKSSPDRLTNVRK